MLEEARERVARLLGAQRKEIVFVANGSEADALATFGLSAKRPGGHIVSSAIEHLAILASLEARKDEGYDVTLLPVDGHGFVDPGALRFALRDDTALVTIMYANNEIGTIQPIRELAAIARQHSIAFHTDAVAAAGWLPISVDELGVDGLSLAAHKIGGPKGIGILYVRDGMPLVPLVHGGGQERGMRAGTEDVAAAVGAAVALELAEQERVSRCERVLALRNRLELGLLAKVPLSRVNGSEPRLPNIANLSFSGIKAEVLAVRLDLEGIAVSPGSACTSGIAGPSHVVEALGTGNPREALRFSLGTQSTEEEVDFVLQVVPNVVSELRRT